ncbi:hypothetical protein [Salinibacter ruber]|uniref:Uncharacterized protein n=1 Tax=Salinibacter ruber TaxID=146919 RepID=A0A9X2PXE6_9BACT|nr:hypothetical protein [Salinibacter ruber]MCS3677172.1 hypothetical protein [Salinibacter ruber]
MNWADVPSLRPLPSGAHLYAAWTHPEEGVQVGRLRTNALR